MRKIQDLSGQTFNRLTVLQLSHIRKGIYYWKCKCSCGNESIVQARQLIRNTTKSCGCFRAETIGNYSRRHGASKSREYISWAKMKNRCLNPNYKEKHLYQDRGITVCSRWLIFTNFLNDMGLAPGRGYSIDRIDNNKGYEPGNCRWATILEQANNKRNMPRYFFQGEEKTIPDWCRQLGLKSRTISARINRGWTIERALTTGRYGRRS